ncbi:hypothetical protein BDY21DRAFT_371102 [Lineolata rhizophorae]|uniref:Uncharacterized protein n=1 Tax=Lineolata rhizophorae TaxID=578093 RepID=A0A6A6P2I3_9PEZI|nr:hypothetical protein BDY21DRAFT_371102 [Lineolata rhizophorae]
MPVLPNSKDSNDQVAKGLSEATQQMKDAAGNIKAKPEHHQAHPGPVMGQDIGEPASKEGLKKRDEELNEK